MTWPMSDAARAFAAASAWARSWVASSAIGLLGQRSRHRGEEGVVLAREHRAPVEQERAGLDPADDGRIAGAQARREVIRIAVEGERGRGHQLLGERAAADRALDVDDPRLDPLGDERRTPAD